MSSPISELLKSRRSIRKFKSTPLEPAQISALVEAIRSAPSWANLQCWRLLIVTDPDSRRKLSEWSFVESYFAPKGYKTNPAQKALEQAPCVFILCADPSRSGEVRDQPYYLVDAGLAAQNLMLEAHALGLGSVFVGVYDEERIKSHFGIPAELRVVGLFPIGTPEDGTGRGMPPRRPSAEWVHHDRWS